MISTAPASWFCLHTRPKHEHIAAAQLRQGAGIEVFVPRIRYKRATRLGPAWVTESLFLNYFFARFNLENSIRLVRHVRGVRDVVHFGPRWPTIPEAAIQELQSALDGKEYHVIVDLLRPGDLVTISGGAMDGLTAVVTRALPAKRRVAVLLDFLGRQTSLELNQDQLVCVASDHSPQVGPLARSVGNPASAASKEFL